MKFHRYRGNSVSITVLNPSWKSNGKTTWDIRVFKHTHRGNTKRVMFNQFETNLKKYAAEKEAAQFLMSMAMEYRDGREEFKEIYDALKEVLTDSDIEDIYLETMDE